MMTTSMSRALLVAVLGIAMGASAVLQPTLVGQEKAAKKAKGRLPPYFAQVVTERQRNEIYEIQRKYTEQIDALEAQLKSLQEQRDTEIESVLSDEQKEKLNKLRADAASRRKTKAAESAEAEAAEPASTTKSTATAKLPAK